MALILPPHYQQKLLPETTEIAIKEIKNFFEHHLAETLHLRRVTAPLFLLADTGLNDDLNGVEDPVAFTVKAMNNCRAEVVHSLAKWKRTKLADYDIPPGFGLYTDMNAIRADEELDNLHSIYVDQWDWEKAINPDDRSLDYLKRTVAQIYDVIRQTEAMICAKFPHIKPFLPEKIKYIHAEELLQRYPSVTPHERENRIAKEYGAVFVIGIGDKLSNGEPHDGRAPDYDDWSTPNADGYNGLNGDIIVWNPVLQCAFELSSMGIRVSPEALAHQLTLTGSTDRSRLPFHRSLLAGGLPLSIGGGIGQSRLCMLLLQKAHIGEVQASIWPDEQLELLDAVGIHLLS